MENAPLEESSFSAEQEKVLIVEKESWKPMSFLVLSNSSNSLSMLDRKGNKNSSQESLNRGSPISNKNGTLGRSTKVERPVLAQVDSYALEAFPPSPAKNSKTESLMDSNNSSANAKSNLHPTMPTILTPESNHEKALSGSTESIKGGSKASSLENVTKIRHSHTPSEKANNFGNISSSSLGQTSFISSFGTKTRSVQKSKRSNNAEPLESQNIYNSTDGRPLISVLYPQIDSTDSDNQDLSTLAKKLFRRRIQKFQNCIFTITDPKHGLFKDKKKMFGIKTSEYCCSGNDLAAWFLDPVNGNGFFSREEVVQFLDGLIMHGYLISFHFNDKFFDDESLYTVQSPLCWVYGKSLPGDSGFIFLTLEYLSYLMRQNRRQSEREYDTLLHLRNKFSEVDGALNDIERQAADQQLLIEKLSKEDLKRFTRQEFGFWQFCNATKQMMKDSKEQEDEEEKRGHTEEIFEATASPEQLLKYWKNKAQQLHLASSIAFKKVSNASKSLRTYCEVREYMDPLLITTNEENNHWMIKVEKIRNNQMNVASKPIRIDDVKLWVNSFDELLRSPIGLGLFREFVGVELSTENLEFWEAVNKLDECTNRAAFTKEAIAIFEEYIKPSSPKEINISSNIKIPLTAHFKAHLSEEKKPLPYDCFSNAHHHIFSLMQNDSYNRFCSSPILANWFKKEIVSKKKGSLLGGGSGINENPLSLRLTNQKSSSAVL